MGVLRLLKHCFGEWNLRKSSELLAGRIDPEVFNGFFDTEEVASHNLTGTLLVGRWLESANDDRNNFFKEFLVMGELSPKFPARSRFTASYDHFMNESIITTKVLCLTRHVFHDTPPFITRFVRAYGLSLHETSILEIQSWWDVQNARFVVLNHNFQGTHNAIIIADCQKKVKNE